MWVKIKRISSAAVTSKIEKIIFISLRRTHLFRNSPRKGETKGKDLGVGRQKIFFMIDSGHVRHWSSKEAIRFVSQGNLRR
jgi:hypothetical protein